ncbi:MAG: hypothetical protein JNK85_00835, partial [Verrucomicrobiales bacterium]|nr:hypothetical protein [Verrucomicrobiales bacterium]
WVWWYLTGGAHAAVVRREALALEGQPAPGGLPGETFGPLADVRARLNTHGDVAFIAPVRGVRADGTPVDGLFVRTAQGLFRLAQEDTPIPGLPPKTFGRLSRVAINDAGNVLVFSQRADSEAYLSNASGSWRVVAQSADPEPAMRRFHRFSLLDDQHQWQPLLRSSTEPDVLFAALPVPALNESGFPGTWTAGADGWNPQAVFTDGQPAPDLYNRTLLQALSLRTLGSSPAHRSVFQGELFLSEPNVSATNAHVIWTRGGRGEPQILARTGHPARVPAAGVFYRELMGASVNGSGTTAFIAGMVPESSGYTRALFLAKPAIPQIVVREGDLVSSPDGTPLGPILLESTPILNQGGQVLFFAVVGNRRILARWSPDLRLEALLMEGQGWADLPVGWRMANITGAHFNASGRVAVFASLEMPDAQTQTWGLWVTDATSSPVLVAMSALEPNLVKPPEGVPLLTEGLYFPPNESFAGDSDGRPRFFSDTQQAVYSGRPTDGPSGVFLVSVDQGVPAPPDDTFRWAPGDFGQWSGMAASDAAAWDLNDPARLFPNAGLFARPDKVWAGARLRLEVVENGDSANDLVGIDGLGLERQRLGWTEATGEMIYANRPLGRLTRPQPAILEVTLAPEATTDGIRALARVLVLGSRRDLGQVLLTDARYVEPRRRLQLRLTDAAGRTADLFQTVDTPKTTDLAFEGISPNHNTTWASGYADFTTITLQPELLLNSGARLRIGCSPIAADLEWFPNSTAQDVTRESSNNRPCAGLTMTFDGQAGYLSLVQLYSWTAQHTLYRQRGFEDVFNNGFEICVTRVFALWLESLRSPAPGPSLASVRTAADAPSIPGSTTDILAGPYAFREWMRQTEDGRRLIRLYEQHTAEVVTLMLADMTLFNDLFSLLNEFSPGLREFLSGRGHQVLLRPDMVAHVNRVFDQLEAKGSPTLRATIQTERARYHGLQDFVGRTFAEWGNRMGINAPETPFVTASSPRLTADGFHVQANRVEGLDYSLWRRSPSSGGLWEKVADAGLRWLEATVQLFDPKPDSNERLYQVRVE